MPQTANIVTSAALDAYNQVTIVDGSATTLFSVPVVASSYVSGLIRFTVYATDGTDQQVISGIATFSAVNKAGTTTRTITYDTANEAKAVSAGTLTLSFTTTDDTNQMSVKLQPTGSLTETTYYCRFTVSLHQGNYFIA